MGTKGAVLACLLVAWPLAGCGTADREREVALELPRGGAVGATGVYVQSAYASLDRGGTDFLGKGPEGWTISAAGCRARGTEQPYECELEG